MADAISNDNDIVIRIDDDAAKKIEDDLRGAGVNIEAMGSRVLFTGTAGKVALSAIGESCREGTLSLGVPGRYARRIGDAAEQLVFLLGPWGIAVGIAALGIATSVAIYMKFIESKRLQRETLAQSALSLRNETQLLYANQAAYYDLQRADYDLATAKRDMLRTQLDMLISLAEKQVRDQIEILQKNGGVVESLKRNISSQFAGWDPSLVTAEQHRQLDYYQKKTISGIEVLQANLKVYREQRAQLNKNPEQFQRTASQYSIIDLTQHEIEMERSLLELRRSKSESSLTSSQDAGLRIFDLESDARMRLLRQSTLDQKSIEDAQANERLQREILLANQYKSTLDMKMSTASIIYGGISEMASRMYDDGGEYLKVLFYISRAAAAIQAYYDYQEAADKASEKPYYGAYLAAWFRFLSFAVPCAILAETIAGDNGYDPSGSAMPIYPVSATGETLIKNRTIMIIIDGKATDTFEYANEWIHRQLPAQETINDQFIVTMGRG
jgi:uncharacterized protein YqiB (DUF1249 family)